jgi:glycosyltransferase involved in cell wall biosynthesis
MTTEEHVPRVTVVIPTFNRSAFLKRAIESVLAQTLHDFELYVSDNASGDDTAGTVASFADPRIVYAPLAENVGAKANFTRALHLGVAPAVALLQDDDLMLPENLERKVGLLERHPHMAIAHSAFRYIDGDEQVIQSWATWCGLRDDAIESGEEYIARSMDAGCRIDFSSAVIRRTMVVGEQFREADGPPCDMGLWLRVARRGSVGYIVDPLVSVRRHGASSTLADGTYDMNAALYQPTFEGVARVQKVKRQFLDEFGGELPNARNLRARARRSGHRRMLSVAANRNASGTLGGLVEQLRGAAHADPGLITDPRTLKLCLERSRWSGKRQAFPFVVGCPRSGTTLLRAMLDSHSQLAIPPESYFIHDLYARYGPRPLRRFSLSGFQAALLAHERFPQWGLREADVETAFAAQRPRSYADALRVVYSVYADANGKARYGDKTPAYVLQLRTLAALFPEARFVHIIRDGRDVALSLFDIERWGPSQIPGAAHYWVRHVSAGREAGAAIGEQRYREVSYERMVDEPEDVLRELCAFLDLEYESAMLDYPDRAVQIQSGNFQPEIHRGLELSPTAGLRSWPDQMSAEDQEAFVAIAGPLLRDLGYDTRISTTRFVEPGRSA